MDIETLRQLDVIVYQFLTALSQLTGYNQGPNGELPVWGTVANYTSGSIFVETLEFNSNETSMPVEMESVLGQTED